jgi:hypothetical protein
LHTGGSAAPSGRVGLKVLRGHKLSLTEVPAKELSLAEILHYGTPQPDLPEWLNRWKRSNLHNLWRGARKAIVARALGVAHFYGQLSLVVIRGNGDIEDYGLVSMRVVTTTGVNFLVDALQNLTEPENLKFHGIGTGTNAEAVGDTALQTELTTEYNPNSTRATGTLTEGASANIFRTVGTNTLDSGTPAVTEHGILSQAATGGGTLLDRSVFSAINLVGANGDSLQSTYDLTLAAES